MSIKLFHRISSAHLPNLTDLLSYNSVGRWLLEIPTKEVETATWNDCYSFLEQSTRDFGCFSNQESFFSINAQKELLAISFLPGMMKTCNNVILFLEDSKKKMPQSLTDAFIASGYSGFEYITDFRMISSKQEADLITDAQWLRIIKFDIPIVINWITAAQADIIESSIIAKQATLSFKYPELMDALSLINELRAEVYKKNEQNHQSAKEIEVLKSFLEAQQVSGEAAQIQHYYDEHYEILPGWYKRVGKVLELIRKTDIIGETNNNKKKIS